MKKPELLKTFLLKILVYCFQIVRRGMPPKGGGEVIFSCPVKKALMPIQYVDPGKIKRIRGVAYPS